MFRNPRERAFEVTDTYADETPTRETLQSLHDTQLAAYEAQVDRLTAVSGRPGRGLEVGSYAGGFLSAARARGWQFEGLDVNESANEFTRSLGFTVTSGDLVTFPGDVPHVYEGLPEAHYVLLMSYP